MSWQTIALIAIGVVLLGVVAVFLITRQRTVLLTELSKMATQLEAAEAARLTAAKNDSDNRRAHIAAASPEELQDELNRRRLPPS